MVYGAKEHENCKGFDIDKNLFYISTFMNGKSLYLTKEDQTIVVELNFCPFCGKQLNNKSTLNIF